MPLSLCFLPVRRTLKGGLDMEELETIAAYQEEV